MPVEAIALEARHGEIVRGILRSEVPDREVRVFGSRARGPAKRYSDLDLLVMGETCLPGPRLAALKAAFEESDLPFHVDVVEWAALSEEFRSIAAAGAVPLLG